MALKITKQIGTDNGITDSAYVRIFNYQINKIGFLILNIQVFKNEEDAYLGPNETLFLKEVRNNEIGNTIRIPLQKTLTRLVTKPVQVEFSYDAIVPVYDENNQITDERKTETKTSFKWEEKEVEEEYQVADLSIIENKDIFAFGYEKLKEKLISLFGAENVVDC